MKKKKILIVGYGYVGKAVYEEMSNFSDVVVVDKAGENIFVVKENENCDSRSFGEIPFDAVFYCLPTPLVEGTPDIAILETALKLYTNWFPSALHVINSTIIPNVFVFIRNTYQVIHVPEFRTENDLVNGAFNKRLIIGSDSDHRFKLFYDLFPESYFDDTEKFEMSFSEAALTKLANNAYLAMRVSFFNEITRLASHTGNGPDKIIQALSSDQRVGDHYNTPSIAFGGPCLPKDVGALSWYAREFGSCPLIESITPSNRESFSEFGARIMKSLKPGMKIGLDSIGMRHGSSNITQSRMIDLGRAIMSSGYEVYFYDTNIDDPTLGFIKVHDYVELLKICDIVITQNPDSFTSASNGIYSPSNIYQLK